MYAVAYGVVADIASPAERGSYVGAVSLGYVGLEKRLSVVFEMTDYGSFILPSTAQTLHQALDLCLEVSSLLG